MPIPEQITPQYIQQLYRQAKSYWQATHEAMDADYREVADGPGVNITMDQGTPPLSINPHTAAGKVHAVVNHMLDGDLDVKVDNNAGSTKQRERGVEIGKGCKAWLDHATRTQGESPLRRVLFSAAGMGMACFFIGHDFSELERLEGMKPEQEPEEDDADYQARLDAWQIERDHAFPIFLAVEDPRTIYPDPGTYGNRWVIKCEKRLVGDIRAEWPGWAPKEGKTDFDEVDWLEMWSAPGGLMRDDPGVYYYEADGMPVKRGEEDDESEWVEIGAGPWEHGYGMCSWVIVPSGFGMPFGKPEDVFVSLIRYAREGNMFRAEAEREAQIHAIASSEAWGGWAVPKGYGENFSLGLNAINEMPRDAQGNLVVPQKIGGSGSAPQGIFQSLFALQAKIDQETISSVLSDANAQPGAPALLFARQVQEASTTVAAMKQNMEHAFDRVWERFTRLMNHPDLLERSDTFRLVGLERDGSPVVAEVGRKLFEGVHLFRTTIDPRFPIDQIGRMSTGLALLGKGAIDLVTYLREFKDDPTPEQTAAKAMAWVVYQQLVAKGMLVSYAEQYLSGLLPDEVKLSDHVGKQIQAQAQAGAQLAAGGGETDGNTRQAASGSGALVNPGQPGGTESMGASEFAGSREPVGQGQPRVTL